MHRVSYLIVFLFFLSSAFGQHCLSSCAAGLSTCGKIQYNVYVNNSAALVTDEKAAAKFLYEFNAIASYNATFTMVDECLAYMQMFICNAFHQSCDPLDPTPTPISMCSDVYYTLNATCGTLQPYFPDYVSKFFDFNGQYDNGVPYYSETTCSRVTTMANPCSNAAPKVMKYTFQCAELNQTALVATYKWCAPYLTETVALPNSWPRIQDFLDAHSIPTIAKISSWYPLSPLNCFTRLMSFMCGNVFPQCLPTYVPFYNQTAGVRSAPCLSTCNYVNGNCTQMFTFLGQAANYRPCAGLYPNSTFTITLAPGQNVTQNCTTYIFPDDPVVPWVVPQADCPAETGKKKIHSDLDSLCDLRCPDASYSMEEWRTLTDIALSGASISLVAMLFLIVTYMLTYEKRKFPQSMHFFEFIATALFAASFLIGGNEPQTTTWCYDGGTNGSQSNNTRCGVQGFFFIYFGIALTTWCCVIAFILFYGVVLNKKIALIEKYSYLCHLFGWGVPMVFAVAALASNSIGYGPPLAWCFIHFDGFGFSSGGLSKDYIFFYIPEAVLFVAIFFMFLAVVAKLASFEYAKKQKITPVAQSGSGVSFTRAQVRILVFVFTVFIICFTIFEWRLQIQGNNNLATVGLDWTLCKLRKEVHIPNPQNFTCDGDTNPARVNYQHTAFESSLLSGIGALIFIAFGADTSIYSHWLKIFKLIKARDWAKLKGLVMYGKDPYASSREDNGTSTVGGGAFRRVPGPNSTSSTSKVRPLISTSSSTPTGSVSEFDSSNSDM